MTSKSFFYSYHVVFIFMTLDITKGNLFLTALSTTQISNNKNEDFFFLRQILSKTGVEKVRRLLFLKFLLSFPLFG